LVLQKTLRMAEVSRGKSHRQDRLPLKKALLLVEKTQGLEGASGDAFGPDWMGQSGPGACAIGTSSY
jgi:hypothetical protein